MAKLYYTLAEALQKLKTDENGLRGLVRDGKLREFREGNAMTYKIEEVETLAAQRASDSGTGEFTLEAVEDSGAPAGGKPTQDSGIGLSGSFGGSSILSLEDTNTLQATPDKSGGASAKSGSTAGGKTGSSIPSLDDSRTGSSVPPAKSGSGTKMKASDSGAALSGSDVLNLEDIDKEAPSEGAPRKDDTVITNVGISVFDDDDLEIAADPMAKTVAAGGVAHLGLDGSGAGSGLLDLTRESDDTSLGADVLSDIESTDEVAETVESSQTIEETEGAAPEMATAAAAMATAAPRYVVAGGVLVDDPSVPIFSGLLIAGMLVLAIAGSVTAAMTLDVWPGYLDAIYNNLLIFAGGTVAAGGLFALIGWLIGRQPAARPKTPKPAKAAKAPKKGKGKGE
jgi:hypothetical protein